MFPTMEMNIFKNVPQAEEMSTLGEFPWHLVECAIAYVIEMVWCELFQMLVGKKPHVNVHTQFNVTLNAKHNLNICSTSLPGLKMK